MHAGWIEGLGVERGGKTETATESESESESETKTKTNINTNTNNENTHPSQNRRRMGHPQRLGQESEEWSSGIIRAGVQRIVGTTNAS